MSLIDWMEDGAFLLLGIAGAVLIIVKRKKFDLWAGLIACVACIMKGIRLFYYDSLMMTLRTAQGEDILPLMQDVQETQAILNEMDKMIILLLLAALICLFIQQKRRGKAKKYFEQTKTSR